MRVLIVGGYGTFGGRLVDLLADEPRLTLIVAGRSLTAAEAFCRSRQAPKCSLVPSTFDRDGDVDAALATLAPDLVVDASGPFQAYKGDAYRVVRAAFAAGADYIDLADAASFVRGIAVLDEAAVVARRFALSGASSFPALTAAVVRRVARELSSVEGIVAGIAPSPYAGVGLNVVRAIAAYTGQPVTVIERGKRVARPGFVDSRTMTVAVPGHVPLPPIRFALAEVPDLALLPDDWPTLQTLWMGAGPTPAALHRLLWAAGWLVKLGLLPSLSPFARIMNAVVNAVRWGEHRGGMVVEVAGTADGRPVRLSWHLLADGDAGPLIPSMAAEALIRGMLQGRRPAPGARAAHRALELDDYEAMFVRRGIATGTRTERAGDALHERMLGTAYARLAEPIQVVHRVQGRMELRGRARIERGGSMVARLVARVFGFPPAAVDTPVEVTMTTRNGTEVWQRRFGAHAFTSVLGEGRGRMDRLMVERFGPVAVGLAVTEEGGRLGLTPRRWSAFGVPMPKALMPRVTAYESADDGRFHFHVDIGLPLVGRVVLYDGWLVPVA
jgi:hypothetical protein